MYERGGGGGEQAASVGRTRECRKSQRITRQTRRKVVIRIVPVSFYPAKRFSFKPLATFSAAESIKSACVSAGLQPWSGMRWIWCRNSLLKDNAAKLKSAPAGSHGTACR